MKKRLLLLPLILLLGCADPAPPLSNLLVLGHAGSGFFTPLNPFNPRPPSSWAGVENALDLGADGVEVDLQLSRDSVPVLYHNQELETMTATGRGCVSQLPAAQLTRLAYRGGPPYDWFHAERLIRFDTLLARLGRRPGPFPRLHLDLHEQDMCQPEGRRFGRVPALLRALGRALAHYQVPAGRALLITMNLSTLQQARALLPALPRAYEVAAGNDLAAALHDAQAQQAEAIVLSSRNITPAQTAQVRAAGLRVVVFGGRSAGSIGRILAARPDEMEVDNVGKLLKMQGRR